MVIDRPGQSSLSLRLRAEPQGQRRASKHRHSASRDRGQHVVLLMNAVALLSGRIARSVEAVKGLRGAVSPIMWTSAASPSHHSPSVAPMARGAGGSASVTWGPVAAPDEPSRNRGDPRGRHAAGVVRPPSDRRAGSNTPRRASPRRAHRELTPRMKSKAGLPTGVGARGETSHVIEDDVAGLSAQVLGRLDDLRRLHVNLQMPA